MKSLGKKIAVAFVASMVSMVSMVSSEVALAANNVVSSSVAEDEKSLRAQAGDYARSYAAGDARALAAMWADDGTYTTIEGRQLVSRDAIEKYFSSGFKEHGANPIDINVESIRFPAGNVAIEEGTSRLKKGPASGKLSRYSVVHIKRDGKWVMLAVTEVDADRGSQESLKDLGWLIGSWTARGAKGEVHLEADWAGDQKFIHCTFRRKGESKPQQVQLIGWNPITDRIASWHFDANGGFGRGSWMRDGQAWIENASGVESDGTIGSGINIFRKIDDNSFNWRSTGRRLGGQPLPDTADITVVRDRSN